MNVATATGLAMNAVCEPSMVPVVAPIRCAMNRSASGEIALSCSETRNQDGLVFHPAAVAFSWSAATASGRWVANMTSATSTGTSAQNVSRNPSFWDVQVGTARGAGRVVGGRGGRLGEQRRRERLLHARAALAHLQPERREKDQAGHVLQAGGRLGDSGASVGIPRHN